MLMRISGSGALRRLTSIFVPHQESQDRRFWHDAILFSAVRLAEFGSLLVGDSPTNHISVL